MVIGDEVQERNLAPEAVNADDARWLLYRPHRHHHCGVIAGVPSTSSPEVRALLGVATVGRSFVKTLLLYASLFSVHLLSDGVMAPPCVCESRRILVISSKTKLIVDPYH